MSPFHRVLTAFLLLIGLLAPAAQAADDPCANQRNAKPAATNAIGRELAGRHSHGLLWKIERAGTAPSHLFGTIHLDDPRVTNLPSAVIRPLVESKSYNGEVVLDPRAVAYYTQSMYFEGTHSLRELLPQSLFEKTAQILTDYGVPHGAAERLKPWAAFTLLGRPKPTGDMTLDALLQDTAERKGIPVYGLETIEELVATLDGIPMRDQVEILKDTVCNRALIEAQTVELTDRYLEHDLAGMMAVSRQYEPEDKALYEAFMKRLVTDRNRRMVERMQPRLAEGGAFIAIGAMHLPGVDGLLQLLEERGYRVTAVY